MDPTEIGGVREEIIVLEYIESTPDTISSRKELPLDEPDPTPEVQDPEPANVRTQRPKVPIEPREKSTRIWKPPVRFNLGATTEPRATLEKARKPQTALMSVARGLRLFKTETQKAIELGVASLLAKTTFIKVDADIAPHSKRAEPCIRS
jgi:hypothetical protein